MKPLEEDENWSVISDIIKQKWSVLTEGDLKYTQGKEVEFVANIQTKTGAEIALIEKVIREARITGDVC